MKHSLLAAAGLIAASAATANPLPANDDSTKTYGFDEVVIVAQPKETQELRRQPLSVSSYGAPQLSAIGANTLHSLSAYAPGFFMPDYGSRLTSAIYIRGIGSRSGASAVSLYVDNMPYTDKSAYSFSFLDVTRIDVLRGSQGTLYGQGAMGGLVRIFTADPLRSYGTDISLGGETDRQGRHVKAVTYIHPAENFAISAGGFYEGEDGFFTNRTTGEKADRADAAGAKLRMAWEPSERLRFDLSLSGEYSDEAACPYFPYDGDEHDITQNRQSSYRRKMFTAGLNAEWQANTFVMNSVTSFQHLSDRLFMDQDFSAADIFSLTQKQHLNALTQEVVFKSRPGRRWQWQTGAYGMIQHLNTRCPVTFHSDGMAMLNGTLAAVLPQHPPMTLAFTDDRLPLNARLRTPSAGAALFHQSTLDLGGGFSATAGLRVDYDYHRLTLNSGAEKDAGYRFTMPSFGINTELKAQPRVDGRLSDHSWQLLPKLALQYNHRSGRGNVYVAVSKGYRAGGYNIQSYSDLSQTALQRDVMTGVRDFSVETINRMPLPEAVKEKAIAGLNAALNPHIPPTPDPASLAYKPEQSWNYEMGGHLKLAERLNMDYTFFYIHTTDLQLSRFSESGMGRELVNAGSSRSCGGEVTLRSSLLNDRLTLSAAYGYANARFKDYDMGNREGEKVDWSGNRVPFAPEHTLGATAQFRQPTQSEPVTAVSIGANFNGAGSIYWDEANTARQPFYARLNAHLTAEFGKRMSVTARALNVTGSRYSTFSFESMGKRFAQLSDPRSFAIDVNLHF